MAQDVVGRDGEVGEKVCELVAEEGLGPECRVAVLFGEVRGAAVAELIVEEDGDGVVGLEVGKGEKIFVAAAWAAVEGDEGNGGGGEGADDFIVGLAGLVGGWDGERGVALGHGRGGDEHGFGLRFRETVVTVVADVRIMSVGGGKGK